MKTFFLFLAITLAHSVGATEANKSHTQLHFIESLEAATETNRSHTRRHFGTKDESSKQLVPFEQDSSKQVQLITTKADQKEKVQGFAAIIVKWGGKCGAAYTKAFPATSAKIKSVFTQIKLKTGWTAGATRFKAWSDANPTKAAGLKFVFSAAFAVSDAVVSTLIVAACPPTVGILIADAAIEFASAVFDMAGGDGSDQQTARVAWQGLALILAIGGIDGEGVPGADSSALADAMGAFWYGVSGNVAGEFSDAMGGNLAKLNDADAQAKAKVANDKIKASTTGGKAVKVKYSATKEKNRKIYFLEDKGNAAFKTDVATAIA